MRRLWPTTWTLEAWVYVATGLICAIILGSLLWFQAYEMDICDENCKPRLGHVDGDYCRCLSDDVVPLRQIRRQGK